jgi:hypothetical protein
METPILVSVIPIKINNQPDFGSHCTPEKSTGSNMSLAVAKELWIKTQQYPGER